MESSDGLARPESLTGLVGLLAAELDRTLEAVFPGGEAVR